MISISGAGTLHTIYSIIRGATSDMRKSELSKWGLNELCCKRTVYRWNRLELNFPLMYGTGTLQREQIFLVRGVLHDTVCRFVCVELPVQIQVLRTRTLMLLSLASHHSETSLHVNVPV